MSSAKKHARGAIYLRGIPGVLKKGFKASCARNGITMHGAMSLIMQHFSKPKQLKKLMAEKGITT